jgi:hypothetical protein
MERKYLSRDEVATVLSQGKSVVSLLAVQEGEGRNAFAHCAIVQTQFGFRVTDFQTIDFGSRPFEMSEWGPSNPNLDIAEAEWTFESLRECFAYLEIGCPGSTTRLVGEGMLQNEFEHYRRESND